MPQSHRLRNRALIGLAGLVTVLCVLSLVDLTIRQNSGAYRIQRESAEDQQHRQSEMALCSGKATLDLVLCVRDAEAAYREAQRSHDDLEAQQESARAAFWMVAIGCIQALVAIGGFAIVFRSLDYSAEGIKAANEAIAVEREMSERGLRAYVGIEKATVVEFSTTDVTKIEVVSKNNGQTPAHDVSTLIVVQLHEKMDGKVTFLKETYLSRTTMDPGQSLFCRAVSGRPVTNDEWNAIKNGKKFIVVAGKGQYWDVFKKRHRLIFRYTLAFDHSGNAVLQASKKNNRSN